MSMIIMNREQCLRLQALLQELRGTRSIRGFCTTLPIHYSAWRAWELLEAAPTVESLQRIADLKKWTLDQLMTYLKTGSPDSISHLEVILQQARKLPLEERVKLAKQLLE